MRMFLDFPKDESSDTLELKPYLRCQLQCKANTALESGLYYPIIIEQSWMKSANTHFAGC